MGYLRYSFFGVLLRGQLWVNDIGCGFLFDFILKLNEYISETSARLVYKYYEGWMKCFKKYFSFYLKKVEIFVTQNKWLLVIEVLLR